MLSYRHAFHAGNHADVLKHTIELMLLRYLNQKDKPWWYVDSHAGAGCYELTSGYAAKNAEYESGIARLWSRADLPPAVADYVGLVKSLNPDGQLHLYPGSPLIALQTMRADDRLRLFELHPSDSKLLQENFADAGKRAAIQQADGFAGLKALLPPPPRRGLVLIDPSYEEKQDYERVVKALKEGLSRFSGGTYALWYPQLTRLEAHELPQRLKRLPAKWLHVALRVREPAKDGFGMHGSGMFVINPPWTLHDTLTGVMPYLVSTLGSDSGAGYVLEQSAA